MDVEFNNEYEFVINENKIINLEFWNENELMAHALISRIDINLNDIEHGKNISKKLELEFEGHKTGGTTNVVYT